MQLREKQFRCVLSLKTGIHQMQDLFSLHRQHYVWGGKKVLLKTTLMKLPVSVAARCGKFYAFFRTFIVTIVTALVHDHHLHV